MVFFRSRTHRQGRSYFSPSIVRASWSERSRPFVQLAIFLCTGSKEMNKHATFVSSIFPSHSSSNILLRYMKIWNLKMWWKKWMDKKVERADLRCIHWSIVCHRVEGPRPQGEKLHESALGTQTDRSCKTRNLWLEWWVSSLTLAETSLHYI